MGFPDRPDGPVGCAVWIGWAATDGLSGGQVILSYGYNLGWLGFGLTQANMNWLGSIGFR